jgi:hypothetical protein
MGDPQTELNHENSKNENSKKTQRKASGIQFSFFLLSRLSYALRVETCALPIDASSSFVFAFFELS